MPVVVVFTVLLIAVVGLLTAAAILRGAIYLFNHVAGAPHLSEGMTAAEKYNNPAPNFEQFASPELKPGDAAANPNPYAAPTATSAAYSPPLIDVDGRGIREPSFGRALWVVFVEAVVLIGVGIVVNFVLAINGPIGPQVQIAQSIAMLGINFFLSSAVLAGMLETTYAKAMGVAFFRFVIWFLIGLAIFMIIMALGGLAFMAR